MSIFNQYFFPTQIIDEEKPDKAQNNLENLINKFGDSFTNFTSDLLQKSIHKVNETIDLVDKTLDETLLKKFNEQNEDYIEKTINGVDEPIRYLERPKWFDDPSKILFLQDISKDVSKLEELIVPDSFDHQQWMYLADECLKLDENLVWARYKLVPSKINETKFWRSYFFLVSMIDLKPTTHADSNNTPPTKNKNMIFSEMDDLLNEYDMNCELTEEEKLELKKLDETMELDIKN